MADVGGASLGALVEALHDNQSGVPCQAALELVRFGPRALAAVAPHLDAYQQDVRLLSVWIARTIAADQMASGLRVGWPAVLHALLAIYDATMPRAERTRLTRAVVSMLREHPVVFGP